jgi:peptide/nickel transport system substrate-binding protein
MSHFKNKNGISRRQFATNVLAASVGAYAIGTGVFPGTARAETPKSGGLVRFAMESSSPNDTLDPIGVTSNIDATRCFQLYNNLVRMGNDLRPEPSLAESWEADSTATDWTFKIRPGVEFHNGKTLTSADVVYSIRRHLGENTESRIKAYMAQIAEVSADGDLTVRIKISSPNAEFPILFSSARAGIIPEGHTDFENPVGTGPFKVKEFRPGIRSLFERNPNYWRNGMPYVDAVETFSIPDPVARINALLAGEVEAGNSLDAKSVPLINLSPNLELIAAKGGQLVYQAMMADRAPTENKDFRLAMKYLQDRERVVKGVYKGFAQIGNDHPIAPSDPMYCADIPVRAYDPDKAKFHLKQAGLEGTRVDIYTSTTAGPGNVEQSLMFQQTAAAAGLSVQVRQTPPEGYWSATAGKFPIFGSHWNARPTADLMYSTIHLTNSPGNETKYFNEKIDQLVTQARATLDEAKRKAIWCDLQLIIHEDGGDMVSCFVDYLHGRSSSLKGIVPHPMGGLSDQFNAETVWLES